MPLNFTVIEDFIIKYRETMRDKSLLRQERYKILSTLRDALESVLKDYEIFERELTALVIDKIQKTTNYEEILKRHKRAVVGVEKFFLEEDTITDVHDLFRIIRDGITKRILELVEKEMEREGYGLPPVGYLWAGLGSEGRDEQTMMTDQDNMIIYEDVDGNDINGSLMTKYIEDSGNSAGTKEERHAITNKIVVDHYFKVFSEKVVDRLDEVGFKRCKGNVMPSNEKWRGSLSDWKSRLDERVTYERGIFEMLDVIILTDARCVAGNEDLLDSLLKYFFHLLGENSHVMKDFVKSAVLMPTALTFFGNFKTEKNGENKDKFNIKLMGWAPLIMSVRMASLSNNIYETHTIRRIKRLRERNVIKKEMEHDLIDAYFVFVKFRIVNQINNKNDPGMNNNYVRPDMLGPEEEGKLRKSMKTLESFQKYIQEVLLFGQPM